MRTEDRGATPNEAAMAASLAEKIAKRYGLDANPVEGESRYQIKDKRLPRWAHVICPALEKRFGIRGSYDGGGGVPVEIVFHGPTHLTSVAAWLFRAINVDLDKRSYIQARASGLKGGDLLRFRNQFRLSAAFELSERLNPTVVDWVEPTEQQRRDAQAESEKSLDEYMRQLKAMTPKEREAERLKVLRDSMAIQSGRAFGKEVDIGTNAVGDRRASPKRLEYSS